MHTINNNILKQITGDVSHKNHGGGGEECTGGADCNFRLDGQGRLVKKVRFKPKLKEIEKLALDIPRGRASRKMRVTW